MTAFQYRDQPYTFSYAALELSTDWGNWWAKLARFRVRMGLEAAAGRLPLWVNSLRGKRVLVRPARFERATSCSGGKHSIQLSYGRIYPFIVAATRSSVNSPGH